MGPSGGIIDWYGRVLAGRATRNPSMVRRGLNLGYRAVTIKDDLFPSKDLPLHAQTGAKACLHGVTDALAHIDEAVVTSIFMSSEIFSAMGLRPVTAEAIANFCAATHAEKPFVVQAEAEGIPETYCSYHKVLLGLALCGVMEPPRLLASCAVACDANNLTFKYLGNLWGTVHVYIDVPYEVSRDSAVYVAGQLRELCGTTQELYGRVLDEGKLREQVARSQRTLRNLASSLEMRRGRDLRSTMANEMQQMIAMHLSLGLPRTELMTEQLLSGLPGAQGYGGVSLVWGHSMPFLIEPIHQMLDCNPRAQVVVNEMLCDQILPKGEDFWFGPDQPYEAMAERLVRNSYNGPATRRLERLLQLCEGTDADGAVIFAHWGCKETSGATQLLRRGLEDAGYPTLILDGDGCDRANCMPGQMSTRLSAFIEMLQARREGRDA